MGRGRESDVRACREWGGGKGKGRGECRWLEGGCGKKKVVITKESGNKEGEGNEVVARRRWEG